MKKESSNLETTEVSEEQLIQDAMSNLSMFKQPDTQVTEEPTEEVEETEEVEDEDIEESDQEVEEPIEEEETEEPEENGLPIGVQKRIDKLTAISKSKDEKIQALEDKLNALSEQINQPRQEQKPSNTLDSMDTFEKLEQFEENQLKLLDFIEEHLDEGVTLKNDDGTEEYYSPEDLRSRKLQITKAQRQVPKRRKYLQQKTQASEYAKTVYPELFDRSSPAYQAKEDALRAMPSLKDRPDYEILIGDMLIGQMARANMNKKSDKQQVKKAIAPKIPKAGQKSPAKQDTNVPDIDKLFDRAATSDSADDVERIIMNQLKRRKSA